MLRHRASRSGFTVIELMITTALVAMMAFFSFSAYQSFQVKNDLDIAVNTIVQSLWRAQILAQASDGDMSWGVKVQSGSIVLFGGASFSARDAAYDESFDLPSTITPAGVTEVVYEKFTGVPQTTGTTTLTTTTNESRTIILNSKGTLTY